MREFHYVIKDAQGIHARPAALFVKEAAACECKVTITKDGREVTEAYEKGAEAALAVYDTLGCDGAILKAKSPSCGVGLVYDGTFTGTLVPGAGVTAACFRARGIPICTEECLLPMLSADTTEDTCICCKENAKETRG